MFQIELSQALAFYSLILAVLVVIIWAYTELSIRRPQRTLGKQFLWRCTYCGCAYLDETAKDLSRCPRCESYNVVSEGGAALPPKESQQSIEESDQDRNQKNPSNRKRHHQRRRGPRRRR